MLAGIWNVPEAVPFASAFTEPVTAPALVPPVGVIGTVTPANDITKFVALGNRLEDVKLIVWVRIYSIAVSRIELDTLVMVPVRPINASCVHVLPMSHFWLPSK